MGTKCPVGELSRTNLFTNELKSYVKLGIFNFPLLLLYNLKYIAQNNSSLKLIATTFRSEYIYIIYLNRRKICLPIKMVQNEVVKTKKFDLLYYEG